MRLEFQLGIAFAIDVIAGDPRWFPHPVRAIGWIAAKFEAATRKLLRSERWGGFVTWTLVVGIAWTATWGLIRAATELDQMVGICVSIALLYTTFAVRSLFDESMAVVRALQKEGIEAARKKLARIVGRDTENLDEGEVLRATVETVAENIVDGVTAPLFFAAIGGAPLAMAYKAINTMDSMFGYRNERYGRFGTVPARMDDVANFIPARLTGPLVCLAALLTGQNPWRAWQILRRDRKNHPSPNSAIGEAAAGALGVRLGGLNYYGGKPSQKPFIGDPVRPLERRDVLRANLLMIAAAVLAMVIGMAARLVWQLR